jgi:hypothetical protein
MPAVIARRLLLASSIVTVACGGSPAAPGAADPPFRTSSYTIVFSGDSFACGDIKNPQAGTTVYAGLTMQAAGGNRSTATSAGGSLTLHFQRDEGRTLFSAVLSGSAAGFADDEGLAGGVVVIPPNGTRMTIQPGAPLSGEAPIAAAADFAFGVVNGTVVFSRAGVTSACPAGAVRWTLNRG